MSTVMSGTADVPKRKRGRPAGKNRKPLSAEERRARNALYERQRREGLGEAINDLIEIFGCDQNITTKNLLLIVHRRLEKHNKDIKEEAAKKRKKRTVEELMMQNMAISDEIKMLEEKLDEFCLRDWVDFPELG